MNLIPISNKTSPWGHLELELDMLGVLGKLVKYVVHLSKRKRKENLILKSLHKLSKLQSSNFWFQGILGVKAIDIIGIC